MNLIPNAPGFTAQGGDERRQIVLGNKISRARIVWNLQEKILREFCFGLVPTVETVGYYRLLLRS